MKQNLANQRGFSLIELLIALTLLVIGILSVISISFAASKSPGKKVARQKPAAFMDKAAIHNCASCHTLSKEEAGTILKGFGEVKGVKMAPVKGLYEVTIQRDNRQATVYVDFGKKLLAPGPIFDIAAKKPITPPPVELPKILSKADLDKIPLANSIIMGSPSGKKRMFVFTDPDCSFCKRLHEELKKLIALEPELTIYVKMFPLKMHPHAHDKARVILGANSVEMLDKAFAGDKLPAPGEKDKKEPVDMTIKIGESLGINGTPAIILPNGALMSGFRTAEALSALLRDSEKTK